MSDKIDESKNPNGEVPRKEEPSSAPVARAAGGDALDGIEDIDFLLEEIENKIAPLALA